MNGAGPSARPETAEERTSLRRVVQWTGLFAAPALAALVYVLLPDAYPDRDGQAVPFTQAGRATAAVAVWMAAWWMTEAIPVYATALLPLAVLPIVGARSMEQAAAPYGDDLIFLFMGGFILALAMQRWGLHRRVAFFALGLVGTRPERVVGVFMAISAGLSMWVSNTATVVMLLPVALSVIERVGAASGSEPAEPGHAREQRSFAVCLLLGVAYAASIGGIGTLIGTPPNVFLASYAKNHLGVEIGFARWMGIGLPLVAVFLPTTWLLLTRWLYPIRIGRIEHGRALNRTAFAALGPMKRGEWATLVVFALTASLWITRPLLAGVECFGAKPFAGLTDPGIAMLAALALFVIPLDPGRRVFAMNWETAVKLPWGILVLFGGGLSLAAAIQANGVGEWLGSQVSALAGFPSVVLVLGVVALMIFLTELTSNTATTAALVPILAGLAPGLGLQPLVLVVPAAIAASCAFMLPVATPPNAVVFGSGAVTISQMSRAGLWLNLIGIALITALTYAVALPLLGVGAALSP
jgi:sodium-dependent dicarboxylate transporter 2/3/5